MGECRVGATNRLRDVRVPPGDSLHVHLVDHRLVNVPAQRPIALPVERIVDDDGLRHIRSAVRVVALEIVSTERIGKYRGVPLDGAGDGAGIRVHEQFGRIAPVTLGRIPRAMDAKAVSLAGAYAAQIPVPAVSR